MATTQGEPIKISRDANADLSSSQFLLLVLTSSKVAVNTSAGGSCLGVLQNKPVADAAASVTVLGPTRVVSGAAFSEGDDLSSDGAGKAITTTGTNQVVLRALADAGGADEIVEAMVTQAGINAIA